MVEERVDAVIDGRIPLSSDLARFGERLEDAAVDALSLAGGLERAESAADDLAAELSDISREATQATASVLGFAGAVGTADAALSDFDTDVDLDFDTNADTAALSRAFQAIPEDVSVARRSIDALAADIDGLASGDREQFRRRFAVTVDRSGLPGALDSFDDETIDINPVLRDLETELGDQDLAADNSDRRETITVGTDDTVAAMAALDALRSAEVDAETALADLDRQGDRTTVSLDIEGVAESLADIESVEGALRDIDGERARATVAVDVDRSALRDTDFLSNLDTSGQTLPIDIDTDADLAGIEATHVALSSLSDRETVTVDTGADLSGLVAAAAGVETLPDDPSVLVETESDLGGIVALSSALAVVPDRHTTTLDTDTDIDIETDMDVAGSLAHLEAVEASLADIDGRRATATVNVDTDHDIDRSPLHRAAMGLGIGPIDIPVEYDVRGRLRDVLSRRGEGRRIDIPVDFDVRDRLSLPDFSDRLSVPDLSPLNLQSRFLGGADVPDPDDRQVNVTLGDSERRFENSVADIHRALLTLPERHDTAINTEADLDNLVETVDSFDALPREVHSEVEVGANTADVDAALARAFAEAKSLDDLDVTVDTDVDTHALNVARRGGGGWDFDLPDFDQKSRTVDSYGMGVRAVGKSLARLTRTSGAIEALSGLGPKATTGMLVGGGGALTLGVSLVTAGVSGLLGTLVGGAGLAAGIALPVFLNLDEREKKQLAADVKASLAPLRGGEWEQLQTEITAEIPDLTGEFARAIDDSQPAIEGFTDRLLDSIDANRGDIGDALSYSIDELSPEFGDLSVGFFENLPGLIRGTTDSARGLLSFIDDASRASGPLVDNMVTLGEGTGDLFGPLVVDGLEFLSTLSPILGATGEFFSLIGHGIGIIGEFERSVNRAGESVSALRALGGGPLIQGSIVSDGWYAELQGALDAIYGFHNAVNDLPGASLLPSVSEKDLVSPDIRGGSSPDSGGSGSGPAAGTDVPSIQSAAVASLPSATAGVGTGSSTATTTASTAGSTATTAGTTTAAQPSMPVGGGTTNKYNITNHVTVEATNTSNATQMRRVARNVHNELTRMTRKKARAGNAM